MSKGPMYPSVSVKMDYNESNTKIEIELLNPMTGHMHTGRAEGRPQELENALALALDRVRELRERIGQ